MPLISIVLGPENAHSVDAPWLRAPLLQGGLRTFGLLPGGHEALRLVKAAFFLSRREFLPLLPQLGLSVVAEVPLIQFSVLSQG